MIFLMDQKSLPTNINDGGPPDFPNFVSLPTTRKNIPIEAIIELRQKGLSCSQIAKQLDCSKANIIYRLKYWADEIDNLPLTIKHRADFLAMLGHKIGCSLSPGMLQKASVNNWAFALRQIHEMERLERGQSTQNIQYADIIRERDRLADDESRLLSRFPELQNEVST